MEKSGEPYSQFQNETPTNTLPRSSPPPMYSPVQPNFSVDQQMAENCRRKKRLATVEMVISCILLLFGITSTILGNIGYNMAPHFSQCITGTNIWAPVLGIIAAGLGLGALRYDNYNRGCLLISHFVMCIISALAFGILIIISSFCIVGASYWLRFDDYYYYRGRTTNDVPKALIAFEASILIGALANMIANIVSSSYMCRYWCGKTNGAGSTVIYIPSQVASGNGAMQAISVPPGAQVIFLPSNNQGAPVAVPQTHMAA